MGFIGKPQLYPLQSLINPKLVEFGRDKLDNSMLSISLEPEPIVKVLKNFPQQKVVNLSLQVGKMGFVYEEKWLEPQAREISPGVYEEKTIVQTYETPQVKTQDAYTLENAQENLPKLFELCRSFPDKLFVAACGNTRDDIREARKLLASDWPNNLLLIGEWDDTFKYRQGNSDYGYVYGADIYVDNQSLGLEHGSSFSTPVVGALASIMMNQGLTVEETKEKILHSCDSKKFPEYSPKIKGYTDQETQVLNLDLTSFQPPTPAPKI